MEIILQKDVTGLGKKNTLLKVKNGYARNYLIPKGLAILATKSNKKDLAEDLRQALQRAESIRNKAQKIADQLDKLVLNIIAKAGQTGKIFGSITPLQVAMAIKQKKGLEIDRSAISFIEDIKMLGTYTVVIDLHKDIKQHISINVITEASES